MRVGFLIDRWDPERGGAERALALLAQALVESGHEVRVIAAAAEAQALPESRAWHGGGGSGSSGASSGGSRGAWTRVRGRGLTRASRERALARGLVRAAERERCDVTLGIRHLERVDLIWPHGGVHAATLEALWRVPGALPQAEILRRARGRHRSFLDFERALYDRGGAARVLCVSELVRGELVRFHPAALARASVVPNGVDLARFTPERRAPARSALGARLGVPRGAPLVAFIARDPALKGLPELAAALASLADRSWHLVVLGPRRPRVWSRRLAAAGVPPGRAAVLDDGDAAELLAAADLCAHPTWRDTCGLVVLEALASGTPVVTTALAGAARQLAERPDCGAVIATPADGEALRGALAAWLDPHPRPDPERVRSAVEGLDQGPWLAALVRAVEGAAAR